MNPSVSIITVCFNALSSFKKTIQSVIAQNFNNFEYIVIDGGSNDGTKEFLNDISQNDNRIFFISEHDKGIYDAMNKGIKFSRGDWICFMNAGDCFFSNTTLSQIFNKVKYEFDFIYGDRIVYNQTGEEIYQKAGVISDTTKREVVFHQALLTKGAILRKFPYNLTYKYAADYDYIVKSYINNKKFLYLDFPFCYFERGGVSRQQHVEVNIEASNILAKRVGLDKLKGSDFYYGLISNGISLVFNKISEGLKNNKCSLKIDSEARKISVIGQDPINVGNQINGYLSPILEYFSDNQEIPKNECKEKKLISVVTVVYNDKDGLKKTIDSVKGQNFSDYEYIVIDGGSIDGTLDVLKNESCFIDRYISEKDNGIYDAMNKGVNFASGHYVIFMNSGDAFYDHNTLFDIQNTLKTFEYDIVYGDRLYVSDDKSIYQKSRSIDYAIVRMPYCHQSAFVRRKLLISLPFNTTYRFAADYHQVLQFIELGATFKHQCNFPICRFSAGGASESGLAPHLECVKIQIDHLERMKKNRSDLSKSIYFKSLVNNFDKFSEGYVANDRRNI